MDKETRDLRGDVTLLKNATIYGLTDPNSRAIRFVGVTTLDVLARYQLHLRDRAKNKKCAWVRDLLNSGLGPGLVVLEKVKNVEDRFTRELMWITRLLISGADLLNTGIGGPRNTGVRKHSLESRNKMSVVLRGRKFSAEHRKKLSLASATKGKNFSVETRKRMSLAHLGLSLSVGARAKISNVLKGHKVSEKTRKKLKDAWVKRRAIK